MNADMNELGTNAGHSGSAFGDLYGAVVRRLTRPSVRVGTTAGYPRIEVHGITEGQRLDKSGGVRSLSLTVESISNRSIGEAVVFNDENLRLMDSGELELSDGWRCLGVIPEQLQQFTEAAETQAILYRVLQQFNIYVESINNQL